MLLLVLELFAGSGRITQCCRQAGLRADAIDHKPRALSKVKSFLLELTLRAPDLRAVWWAPSYGTTRWNMLSECCVS